MVIVLNIWKTLIRMNLTPTLTLMMNIHLHLSTECLMLPMWPLGQHQHDLHHHLGLLGRVVAVWRDIA